jgi:hypothetical protein
VILRRSIHFSSDDCQTKPADKAGQYRPQLTYLRQRHVGLSGVTSLEKAMECKPEFAKTAYNTARQHACHFLSRMTDALLRNEPASHRIDKRLT